MARTGKGAEGRINAAAETEPRSGRAAPANSGGGSVVGNTSLGTAVGELHKQHPELYSDMGPHQSGSSHIRHQPLGGLKPRG